MTAEGEGEDEDMGENKEDLFEDLDKFFAPIQDVDWPEPSTSQQETPKGSAERSAPQSAESAREGTEVVEEEVVEEEVVEVPEAGQDGGTEPADQGGDATAERGTGEPGAVETSSFDTERDISVESFRMPPAEYADLPGTQGREHKSVAESQDEGPDAPEEEPSEEAVEAAAEHFAESIREEVVEEAEVEPEPETGVPEPEEVEQAILADLGREEPSPSTVKVGGTEGLGGPSWQEPTSKEVGSELTRRTTERNIPAAFLTGLVLAGLAVGSMAIADGVFALVAGAIVLLAQGELYGVMHRHHYQPATALGLVAGGLVLGAAYYRGEPAMLAVVPLATFATFLWYMAVPAPHRKQTTTNVGLTLLGIVYVPLLAGYALITLRALPDGRGLVLSVIGLTFAYDTAAFVLGYFWGSRPLAPTVSPKKSWEGAVAATLVVIALSVGLVGASVGMLNSVGRTLGLGIIVAIFATLGDLAESLLKRDLGVKDMGSILPGHGGVLDRIDSVLFVAPAAFLFFRLVFSS